MSLVELMVALALGLILALIVGGIYLSTKGSFTRQNQISSLQKKARMAFETLVNDTRMVGYQGCFTGKASITNQLLTRTELAGAYDLGIQGYDYDMGSVSVSPSFTLTSIMPNDIADTSKWRANQSPPTMKTVPISVINSVGLTPGSDVLVIRSIAGDPVRLKVDLLAGGNTLELGLPVSMRGWCLDETTPKLGGLCKNSNALVSSCAQALVTSIASVSASDAKITTAITSPQYFPATNTEIFPLQSVVYYVKKGSQGSWPSLYRKVFDGQNATGIDQEVIEGVESMQLRYGVDTNIPADGVINGQYMTADQVSNWNSVVSVRMSLWLRTNDEVRGNAPLNGSDKANDTLIEYPTTSKHDRRVFTTTVALRNRIQLTTP